MSETRTFQLPLLQASQAQKHISVNEALVRLDGLAQITIQSKSVSSPPASFSDGDCYALPAGCSDDWEGQDGKLALASNGGWIYVAPMTGWSAWLVDEHSRATYLQESWQSGVMAVSSNGAAAKFEIIEAEYDIVAGDEQPVGLEIPADVVIFACSARVADPIEGTSTSWTLDLNAGEIVFGTGMALEAGSYCTGILGQPTANYSPKSVRVVPVGGSFTGGRLLIAAHFYRITLPN
ncbi:DUF2793 domain-containing protein [Tropicimonas sp. TH_r6]|uniref:DUF2793 domain-containing protein n=1 Tax=Tropicimonas sp. TH_r6 TaxID=3082085 RepID=UPI002953DBD8|nr:DUF2793 domain-containing protein [Tropicimonas sp. TH_r6]MDV7145082.1 DUF2793 domain-containing protein [Tropicimonas sp. TH_r6]